MSDVSINSASGFQQLGCLSESHGFKLLRALIAKVWYLRSFDVRAFVWILLEQGKEESWLDNMCPSAYIHIFSF